MIAKFTIDLHSQDEYLKILRRRAIESRFSGKPLRRLYFEIRWPFMKARIAWINRGINWKRRPDFINYLVSRSDILIGHAICMYRQTELDCWREYSLYLIELADMHTGTQWFASDVTL